MVEPLPGGGSLKLTVAKYYTPSGRCIQALSYAGGRTFDKQLALAAKPTIPNSDESPADVPPADGSPGDVSPAGTSNDGAMPGGAQPTSKAPTTTPKKATQSDANAARGATLVQPTASSATESHEQIGAAAGGKARAVRTAGRSQLTARDSTVEGGKVEAKLATTRRDASAAGSVRYLDPEEPSRPGEASLDERTTAYVTSNGRAVMGGGGIAPDVLVQGAPLGELERSLLQRGIFYQVRALPPLRSCRPNPSRRPCSASRSSSSCSPRSPCSSCHIYRPGTHYTSCPFLLVCYRLLAKAQGDARRLDRVRLQKPGDAVP